MSDQTADDILYPESEPYNKGYLKVDETHSLYYEQLGRKGGVPIVFLHGGPGGGFAPFHHRFFDPDHFDITVYDQRGAGKSTPYANTKNNSPASLTDDNDTLRQHLGFDKWHVLGGSWGATLALLYAQKYPDRTLSLNLRGVFTMRAQEVDHFMNHMGSFYPERGKEFIEFLPPAERDTLLESYYARIMNDDPAIHGPASKAWVRYEKGCSYLNPKTTAELDAEMDEDVLAFARMEVHFFRNFMPDESILSDAKMNRIRHIPTHIAQGQYDVVCPPKTAFDLAARMDNCHLDMVMAGHSASPAHPALLKSIVDGTNRIRDFGTPVPISAPA